MEIVFQAPGARMMIGVAHCILLKISFAKPGMVVCASASQELGLQA